MNIVVIMQLYVLTIRKVYTIKLVVSNKSYNLLDID